MLETIFRGTLTPASAREYGYFPFQVPPGTTRLEVSYEYEHQGDDAVLDIGLFGPGGIAGGIDFLTGDFRGWSGAFRREFVVAQDHATPGYVPGPLHAGQWHVVLGLQKMTRPTSTFQVTVRVYTGPDRASTQSDARPRVEPATARPQPRWYAGDLHLHSIHSDGENTIPELAAAAQARGLDFLALTDHNTVSHVPHLAAAGLADVLIIPGEEITTYYGHANVWGLDRWLDFRLQTPADAAALIAEVHRRGGLISINHPKDEGPNWDWKAVRGFDCVEVWQSLWWVSNYQALAWWDELLRQGERVAAVGGSDIHRVRTPERIYPHELGNPTTWVWADSHTQEAILEGIRRGHVFVNADPAGVMVTFTARTGDGREFMMGD
ncbi:MAG: CehA/McbA family metallohydrolase, partial [Chloroflexi bacterium]|nr:CehA/McbA family metallohydrolase [Chloroflexota bacterium]